MFRAVPKDPGVPVQAHSPQSAAASVKGPSKADRLTADKAPITVAARRNTERAVDDAGVTGGIGEATVGAAASLSFRASVWVFIVKM